MATSITMPKLGLTMTEGTISQWNKQEGDAVNIGDVLFVVSTDKLTYEYRSEEEGTLLRINMTSGSSVPVGGEVALIGIAGESVVSSAAQPVSQAMKPERPSAVAAPTPQKTATPFKGIRATPKAKALARTKGLDLSLIPGHGEPSMVHVKDIEDWLTHHSVKASPVATRMAVEQGLDLSSLGLDRRIMKADVTDASRPALQSDSDVPMTRMREIISERMTLSATTVPSVNYHLDVDCSAMMELRQQLKAITRVAYTDIIMMACSRILQEFPMCNSSTDINRNCYIFHGSVNIGLAIAVDNGLLVPNVKNVQTLSLGQIADATANLVERGRQGTLLPDEMTGGTFTVSSLGMFGIQRFTPIINPPESCILGVAAIEERAVVRDGQIVVRPMTTLCLTADHRSVDGADAARFLNRLRQLLEQPALLLL